MPETTRRVTSPREGPAAQALRPAFGVAIGFVLLSLTGYVWRPDAGISAPSALLVGLGIFVFAFAVTYACRTLLERDAAVHRRQARRDTAARAQSSELLSFDASLVASSRDRGLGDALEREPSGRGAHPEHGTTPARGVRRPPR